MAAFDPRKLLKQISNPLLQQFFVSRGELLDVDWEFLTKHKIEPVFEAWQDLPDDERHAIQLVLQDIYYLSRPLGSSVLLEQIRWKMPELVEQFSVQVNLQDKAMFVHLHAPELMDLAAQFARSDQLAGGRSWQRFKSLPSVTPKTTRKQLSNFAGSITNYYGPKQMRGRCCEVEHQRRSDGCDYFFAYLDDYPNSKPEFQGRAGKLVMRASRSAFENVFVYNSTEGTLDVSAMGGRAVRNAMQEAFCEHVLDWQFDAASHKEPPYQLDQLFIASSSLPIDPGDGIESVEITRMRLEQKGVNGYIELKTSRNASPGSIYREIERSLNTSRFTRGTTKVRSVTLSIVFSRDDRGKRSTATFDVTVPRTCNLNDRPEEHRRVIERCLKRWGISQ